MGLKQVYLQLSLSQSHVMCMIPLFELNLAGLKHLKDYVERLSPEEVEALGSEVIRGDGKKAFHDVKLETLISESGVLDVSKDPDVSLRLENGELKLDYASERFGDEFTQADTENEDCLIRNSKYMLRNLRWVDSAMREAYEIILNHQKEYLLTSEADKLKPFTQEDVANEMGIHYSTVSRLIKKKTIRNLDGDIMHLNSLIMNQDRINKLRVYEVLAPALKDGTYPHDDDKGVFFVYEKTGGENNGIMLARRTVTKYRQELEEQMCKDIYGLAVYCANAALRDRTRLY